MEIIKTNIPGLVLIEYRKIIDARGSFFESFRKNEFEIKVIKTTFVQENESKSSYGVLRGLHFQLPPNAQSKLVRVINGKVLDIALDIRKGSPTYLKHVSVELFGQNKRSFFIPRGFAHGFVVLSKEATFQYKCDNYYSPESEGSIRWNDPSLNIDWIVSNDKISISEKDKNAPLLNEANLFNFSEQLYG